MTYAEFVKREQELQQEQPNLADADPYSVGELRAQWRIQHYRKLISLSRQVRGSKTVDMKRGLWKRQLERQARKLERFRALKKKKAGERPRQNRTISIPV